MEERTGPCLKGLVKIEKASQKAVTARSEVLGSLRTGPMACLFRGGRGGGDEGLDRGDALVEGADVVGVD